MQTLWLNQISKTDLESAGGKGANLGEMVGLGMPVPGGFVVTAQAYAAQMRDWGLAAHLEPLLAAGDFHGVAAAAEELMLARPMEPGLEAAILQGYREMGAPAVAVRSSATAEDLEGASFAGQQETFLNVEGAGDLLRAVRRCWASLWGHRALHYRQQRGMEHLQVTIAVVVQEMVPAEVAGVLFTVDPIAQRLDRMLVEAAPGLGEAVVSGQVTGDSYRIDRSGALRVADREVRRPGRPVLTEAQLVQLGEHGLRLEAHCGCPQDVEFALADGRIYILQTRPITTLAAVEPEPIPPMPREYPLVQRMAQQMAAERYPIAPKPLDNISMDVLMGGYAHMLRSSGYTVSKEDEAAAKAPFWRESLGSPYARPTVRLLGTAGYIKRLLDKDWPTWWEREHAPQLKAVTALPDLSQVSDTELIALAEGVRNAWRHSFRERFVTSPAYFAEGVLRSVIAAGVGKARAAAVMLDLMGGMQTHTHEANQALWRLSRLVRQGEDAERPLQEFLAAYGHRASTAWYLSQPTWRQEPGRVRQMIEGLAAVEDAPADLGAEKHEAAYRQVTAGLARWPVLPRLFEWLLRRFRRLQVFRENSNFDLTRPLGALQAIAAEWGRRLTARGLLGAADEVHYLYPDEVKAWLSGQAPPPEEARKLIARRRATYQVVNGRWQARLFQAAGTDGMLSGVGASPGVVRAKARLVRGEHEFGRLQPGEVLVCPYSNPSWTPLFASASAVVAETGGAMSHAAIVAREYGIPAVMGVAGALRSIEDGEELLVDGSSGKVTRTRNMAG